MFNLVKMDLYRLFRTKSFYIIFGILAGFAAIIYFSLGSMVADGYAEMNVDNLQLLEMIHYYFNGGLVTTLLSIGICIFVCADYSSGYMKNIASSVKNKANIAISKFITWVIGTLIYFTLLILLIYVFSSVFVGNVVIGDITPLLEYLGMSLFLNIVIVALMILATCFLRSSAASITFAVVALQFVQLIYMAVKEFLNLDLVEYSVVVGVNQLSMTYSDAWSKMMISGCVLLVVYLAGAMLVMRKKDIT